MAIQTNLNERRFGKGVSTVKYPAEDVIQRYVSKDYVGEISLVNETGLWKFNPKISQDSIYGLNEDYVRYADLNNQFATTPTTDPETGEESKRVSLSIDYVTVNDFRDNADVVPEPVPDVNLIVETPVVNIAEGSTGTIKVKIDQQPTWDVVVTLTSQDPLTLEITNNTVTFTQADWTQPKSVTVTSPEDSIISDTSVVVDISIVSQDERYNDLPDTSATVNIVNITAADFILDRSSIYITDTSVFSVVNVSITEPFVDKLRFKFTIDDGSIVSFRNDMSLTTNYHTWVEGQTNSQLFLYPVKGATGLPKSTTITVSIDDYTTDPSYIGLPDKYITYTLDSASLPANEVKVGNTIWKTANEDWTDGGEGILDFNDDPSHTAVYGKLYSPSAVGRLLAANPGYRLPTAADLRDLESTVGAASNSSSNLISIKGDAITDDTLEVRPIGSNTPFNPIPWEETRGLNFRLGGYGAISSGEPLFAQIYKETRLWSIAYTGADRYNPIIIRVPSSSPVVDGGYVEFIGYPTGGVNSDTATFPWYSVRLVKDI